MINPLPSNLSQVQSVKSPVPFKRNMSALKSALVQSQESNANGRPPSPAPQRVDQVLSGKGPGKNVFSKPPTTPESPIIQSMINPLSADFGQLQVENSRAPGVNSSPSQSGQSSINAKPPVAVDPLINPIPASTSQTQNVNSLPPQAVNSIPPNIQGANLNAIERPSKMNIFKGAMGKLKNMITRRSG
jgi:hypothetical protein